jgi:hypothetical protein
MTAVLILCHRGVQNPKIWLDWASCDPKHPIQLFALCENGSDDAVCRQYDLRAHVNMLPSEWAGRNIAHNTFYALKHIADTYPEIEIVYLVSGHCLPVQWPAFFYRKPFPLPQDHVDHPKVWDPRQSSLAVLTRSKDGVVGGVQWISLTGAVIRTLCADDTLLDQLALAYTNGSHPQCPDESYIHTLVSRARLPFQDIAITDQSHSKWDSQSPIEWKLSDRKRRITWDDETTYTENTRGVLWFAHGACYAFSRKFCYLPGICTFQGLFDYAQLRGGGELDSPELSFYYP